MSDVDFNNLAMSCVDLKISIDPLKAQPILASMSNVAFKNGPVSGVGNTPFMGPIIWNTGRVSVSDIVTVRRV